MIGTFEYPISSSTWRRYGEYCPNRHGPWAVGRKNAVRSGSKPSAWMMRRKSPSVIFSG
ncbi:MAG: hypothetical protein NT031_02325 [Planctomycetota bacterium]|nr:hypothetical protein [Planctomycetota bacterium]